jgi:putative kinase
MLNMAALTLELAGQSWDIELPGDELECLHLPLLRAIARQAAANTGRYLVLLAGPPGSGKTTFGALWARLAQEQNFPVGVQTLPLDGFHFPNVILDARVMQQGGEQRTLRQMKGAPETYDLPMFLRALHDLRAGRAMAWPAYDRQLHDPVPDALPVLTAGILILEGNYLLLDEPGWRDCHPLADVSIFVECDETLARERVLARAIRGGRSPASAAQHYARTDLPNRQRIMQRRLASDFVLRIAADGRMTRAPSNPIPHPFRVCSK